MTLTLTPIYQCSGMGRCPAGELPITGGETSRARQRTDQGSVLIRVEQDWRIDGISSQRMDRLDRMTDLV